MSPELRIPFISRPRGLRIAINRKPKPRRKRHPKFWDGLQKAMRTLGHELIYDLDRPADAVLMIARTHGMEDKIRRQQERGAKLVHRLDGMFSFPSDQPDAPPLYQHPKNKTLQDAYRMADAVIYQSEFCRRAAEKHLLPPPQGCVKRVIHNGADPNIFSPRGKRHHKFGFEHMLVVTARWRAWEGLDRTIETFLALKRTDTILVVVGPLEDKPTDHPRIKFLGYRYHKEMAKLYRAADAFLYLPWFDWCPNAVVQALVCGTPVICSSKGGTKEMVGDSGIIVPTEPYDDPENHAKKPALDINKAVEAVEKIIEDPRPYSKPRPDLHIENVARQYLEVISQVTGKA